jgi:hypothetical protein
MNSLGLVALLLLIFDVTGSLAVVGQSRIFEPSLPTCPTVAWTTLTTVVTSSHLGYATVTCHYLDDDAIVFSCVYNLVSWSCQAWTTFWEQDLLQDTLLHSG